MNTSIWLAGTLATHRRKRILENVLSAQPIENNKLPSSGLCFLFGSDFQEAEEKQQQEWLEWSQIPGRTLLLLPPFTTKKSFIPCEWEIKRHSGVTTKPDLLLLQILAPEVNYQLQGKLQIASQIGGTWEDSSINTAYYRKYSHSGIFAITCLPLWSLAVLNQEQELQKWVEQLQSFAGQPVQSELLEQNSFQPKPEHFTVMLHLLTQKFADQETALEALQNSTIFSMESNTAQTCLTELQSQGFVQGVQLTEHGQEAIRRSPYLVYAEVLEISTS